MHSVDKTFLISDQRRGVWEAERERQSPGMQPAQADVGNSTKNPAQQQVPAGRKKMEEMWEKKNSTNAGQVKHVSAEERRENDSEVERKKKKMMRTN